LLINAQHSETECSPFNFTKGVYEIAFVLLGRQDHDVGVGGEFLFPRPKVATERSSAAATAKNAVANN